MESEASRSYQGKENSAINGRRFPSGVAVVHVITWYSSVSGVPGPPGVWLGLRMRLGYRSRRVPEAPAVSDHVPAHPTQL